MTIPEEVPAQVVLVEMCGDHVAVVTLNRPEARNAVNPRVAEELQQAVDRIEADPDVWVAILTGAGGRVFCAGADLKEVSAGHLDGLSTAAGGFAGFVNGRRAKPWIAAVEGLALAGGCEIALACTLIVASEDGAFGLPEVTRGLIAAAGGLYRLPRAIPRRLAIELILTAERLPSRRAAELGMVNRLARPGEALDEALALASAIVANAPLAVRESLAIATAQDVTEPLLQCMSNQAQARLQGTADFAEGPRAFVEKRAPVWTGR